MTLIWVEQNNTTMKPTNKINMEEEDNSFIVIQSYPVRTEDNEIDMRTINLKIETTKPLGPEFHSEVVKLVEKYCE